MFRQFLNREYTIEKLPNPFSRNKFFSPSILRSSVVISFLLLLLPCLCGAGEIRILPFTRVEFTNGAPVSVVELLNDGSEAVGIEGVRVQESGVLSPESGLLLPGDSREWRMPVEMPGMPGNYQAVSRVSYADLNGTRYSLVSVAGWETPGARAANEGWIAFSMAPASIGRSGTVTVSLLLL